MEIDMSRFDIDSLQPPPPPSPPAPQSTSQPIHLPFEKVIVEPTIPVEAVSKPLLPHMSVRSYTIASLQQYTNSFSQDNYIGRGMLGSVYRAQLPNGKLLALKKLEKKVISQQTKEDFIEIVRNLYKIRHANVVEHMVSCSEHGQRILIYEYCSNGTLQDALHSDDGYKKKFSRNACIRMALGTARALEYVNTNIFINSPPKSTYFMFNLHFNVPLRFFFLACGGLDIYTTLASRLLFTESSSLQMFFSMKIFLCVSLICGLAPLLSRGSVSQADLFFPPDFADDFPVAMQLNNMEFAVNLAKRGNLPGAENLAIQRFQELFAQTKYKEAVELAVESPQGILYTPDTVAKFQVFSCLLV
ncbi:putative protein kinase RLK-Pelle-LRR-V family [Helianthus anomalus]